MAELKLTCGATEVLLTNALAGVYRQSYVPVAPSDRDSDVTESAEILVTSHTTGTGIVNSLNRFFERARRYAAERIGDPVYVQYRLTDNGVWWRSEVRDGLVTLPARTLGAHHRGDVLPFQVSWTRQGFWEGALTTVLISNGSGTNQVNLALDNAANNYVTIAAAQVTGDLPAPAKIELTNAYASPAGVLRIGHGFIPATAQAWLIEAESAGGGTASATCSGGQYKALNVTTSETTLLNLTLSGVLLDNARRGYFRIMARFSGNPGSATRLKAQILYGANLLEAGRWIRTLNGQEWLDLGDVQLPPYESGGNSVALTLRLVGRADSNTTLNLDFITLVPLDGWRRLVPVNLGLLGGHTLVDDGPAGRVYERDGLNQVNTFAAYGTPILLQPDVAQKLVFLQSAQSGGAEIDRSATVKVSYRPRKVTL